MVFGRRVKPGLKQRIRSFLWPKSGLGRSTRYIVKRVTRLNATPHAIAAGFAAGAAVSFTPFVGFHFILGFILAWLTRGSLLASAFGTAVGNPLTFPLIFTATYETGHYMLGLFGSAVPATAAAVEPSQTVLDRGLFASGFDTLWPAIKTMSVGALPLGLLVFLFVYIVMRAVVTAFQQARRARRAHKAAARLAHKKSKPPVGLPADPQPS